MKKLLVATLCLVSTASFGVTKEQLCNEAIGPLAVNTYDMKLSDVGKNDIDSLTKIVVGNDKRLLKFALAMNNKIYKNEWNGSNHVKSKIIEDCMYYY